MARRGNCCQAEGAQGSMAESEGRLQVPLRAPRLLAGSTGDNAAKGGALLDVRDTAFGAGERPAMSSTP